MLAYDVRIIPVGGSTLVDFPANDPINEFFVPVGLGLKFNLSRMLNLDLGYRMNFVDGDNFDGARIIRASYHKDKFQYGFLGLEFAFGNRANEQLMFHNPAAALNTHFQTQIDRLQTQVDTLFSRLSTVDTDGDGVFDQFDKEPGTPAGCPVDFRGVSRDTDGDGVPDCKDKQLITPTDCQPVDADGVGNCPPPACCDSLRLGLGACNIGDLPSISFRGNASGVNSDAKLLLATVASKVKSSANCTITITGYPAASKASQALCNRRLDAIKNYLVENEGISSERITTNCEVGGGDSNTVDIRANPL
jgi:outer membrane protein OmpA-like peptidoglycan-associated protein